MEGCAVSSLPSRVTQVYSHLSLTPTTTNESGKRRDSSPFFVRSAVCCDPVVVFNAGVSRTGSVRKSKLFTNMKLGCLIPASTRVEKNDLKELRRLECNFVIIKKIFASNKQLFNFF